MNTSLKSTLVPFVFLFLSACNHTVILPGSMQQRPIVGGKWLGGDINVSLERTVEVEIFDDITTNPPQRNTGASLSIVEWALPVLPSLGANLGLTETVDVYATGSYGFKWMFWGDPKANGWKATTFLGLVNSKQETVENSTGPTDASTDMEGYEFGFSVGHAFSNANLLYVTIGQQRADAETTIRQTAQQFEYDDKFEHTIATLGWVLGEKLYFNVEVSSVQTKWMFDEGGSNTTNNGSFLIGAGGKW